MSPSTRQKKAIIDARVYETCDQLSPSRFPWLGTILSAFYWVNVLNLGMARRVADEMLYFVDICDLLSIPDKEDVGIG
jgi:hypothetical protein